MKTSRTVLPTTTSVVCNTPDMGWRVKTGEVASESTDQVFDQTSENPNAANKDQSNPQKPR